MSVIDEVRAERERQISEEGWTPGHDDTHRQGEIALAAAAYAANAGTFRSGRLYVAKGSDTKPTKVGLIDLPALLWPFEKKWWKPKDRRRDLIRAAALIVAEIERLDRAG